MSGSLLGPSGRYALGAEIVTIGQAQTNEFVIEDSLASSQHAEVRPQGAGYVLVDLGSANGTTLNGLPLQPHMPSPLRGGDVITIGSARITVEMLAGADPYAPTERLAPAAGIVLPPTERLAPSAGGSFAPTERLLAPPIMPGDALSPAYVPPPPPTGYNAPTGLAVPPYPPLYPPPPPRKRSKNKIILLIGGGALAFFVVACTCVGLLLYTIYTHSPQGITDKYYSDMKSQNYTDAYQFLVSTTQQFFAIEAEQRHVATGQQLFSEIFACLDSKLGPVTAYSTTARGQDSVHAAVDVSVTRSRESYTDAVKLAQENKSWKIAFFTPPPNQQCIPTSPG